MGIKIRWLETDAFWCWHYANGWQEDGEIVTVFPRWSHLSFGVSGRSDLWPVRATARGQGHVARARIDPASGNVRLEVLDERATEFRASMSEGWAGRRAMRSFPTRAPRRARVAV